MHTQRYINFVWRFQWELKMQGYAGTGDNIPTRKYKVEKRRLQHERAAAASINRAREILWLHRYKCGYNVYVHTRHICEQREPRKQSQASNTTAPVRSTLIFEFLLSNKNHACICVAYMATCLLIQQKMFQQFVNLISLYKITFNPQVYSLGVTEPSKN